MPKYLFTSDQRISKLPALIKRVAGIIANGGSLSQITDKSENNNATTLKFYYNLQEGTEICKLAAEKPIVAIRNFILKFQFPNVRTLESFNDSIEEGTFLAPYRTVIKVLFLMANNSEDRTSYVTFDEILYYIFCDKEVYHRIPVDYNKLIHNICSHRNTGFDLAQIISKTIQWNQYGRQIGEMMKVLPYASNTFKIKNRIIHFSLNSESYQEDSEFIEEIINFKYIWYPSDSTDFSLSTKEYITYMDTIHTPFNVIDTSRKLVAETDRQLNSDDKKETLQVIYYGSPGTGKSHIVEHEVLKEVPEKFKFRTTFHPDTDYASFVGCYKPVCTSRKHEALDEVELKDVYDKKYKPLTKPGKDTEIKADFIKDYAESINEAAKKSSLNQVIKSLFDTGNDTYFMVMTKLVLEERKSSSQISYKFVPQVFTDAYVAAWQNPKEQIYLVIEEINRGNCAQIFGDLFQLLDRKNGVSQYKVKAEKDLASYLSEVMTDDAAEGIRDGKLSLPGNLNIIATMNTSDQSLFPMDSAFKRRWDWKFIPTTPPKDKNKTIEVGEKMYDWKVFLEKINDKIQEATRSEDKKLGFWFVKTEEGNDVIPASTFASKVVFYLWNDVFKDLGDKSNPFVRKAGDKTEMTSFNSFFMLNSAGEVVVNDDAVHNFMKNIGVEPKSPENES